MITFREIDKSNYMECICLKVKDEQRGFVADNARSLAEARFEEGLYTRAVYSDGVMVGFVLFDYDPELPGWCMSRFMIGAVPGAGPGQRDRAPLSGLYEGTHGGAGALPPCGAGEYGGL